jgi:hypothetical protein
MKFKLTTKREPCTRKLENLLQIQRMLIVFFILSILERVHCEPYFSSRRNRIRTYTVFSKQDQQQIFGKVMAT